MNLTDRRCLACHRPMVPRHQRTDPGSVEHHGRGLCLGCYTVRRKARYREQGRRHQATPELWTPLADKIDEILARCAETPSGCWIWGGAHSKGYGRVYFQGRNTAVHRLTYAYFIADIPEGLHLDHLCRVRRCCLPWHLEPVTAAVNNERARAAAAAA